MTFGSTPVFVTAGASAGGWAGRGGAGGAGGALANPVAQVGVYSGSGSVAAQATAPPVRFSAV